MAADKRTPKKPTDTSWHGVFLASLRANGNVSVAAKAAGVGRRTAYEQREADPVFAAAWEEAAEEAIEHLEDVARRRAERTSDTLLIFLLKSLRPGKYRENIRHEHSGPEGGPIKIIITAKDAKL